MTLNRYVSVCLAGIWYFLWISKQAVEAIKKSQEQLAAQEQLKRLREEKKIENMKLLSDLTKKKQTMLAEQIGQQKKLIHKLESNTLKPEEKEQLMQLIKSLQESIETIKKGLDETAQSHPLSSPQKPRLPQSSGSSVKTKDEVTFVTFSSLWRLSLLFFFHFSLTWTMSQLTYLIHHLGQIHNIIIL